MKKICYLFCSVIIMLFSCQRHNEQVVKEKEMIKSSIEIKKKIVSKKKRSLELDVFSKLPTEIDGSGGCFFSLSKEDMQAKRYICVNNLANLAYISIRGILVEFKLIKYDEQSNIYLYSSKDMSLKIVVKKNESIDDETSQIEGDIVVEKGVEVLTKKFIGICGF